MSIHGDHAPGCTAAKQPAEAEEAARWCEQVAAAHDEQADNTDTQDKKGHRTAAKRMRLAAASLRRQIPENKKPLDRDTLLTALISALQSVKKDKT
jgi:hypothetical protein